MWLSMLDFGSLFGHVPTERLDPGLREWTNVITLVYSCCHCPTMASFNLFDIYVTICSAAVIHAANCSVVETFFFLLCLLYQLFYCSIFFYYYFVVSVVLLQLIIILMYQSPRGDIIWYTCRIVCSIVAFFCYVCYINYSVVTSSTMFARTHNLLQRSPPYLSIGHA